jgi:squalene-hopene/tetraprenyl-beta-curcumene cyclase
MTAPDGSSGKGPGFGPAPAPIAALPGAALPVAEWGKRLAAAGGSTRALLLAERNASGYWEGELSTSALSTATAVMALEMVRRGLGERIPNGTADVARGIAPRSPFPTREDELLRLIDRGAQWLAEHQNPDGGWGDTTRSVSNISTTMLCHAVFVATGSAIPFATVVAAAKSYVERAGGVPALRARYGKDRTFSIPILTHCALAGMVPWRDVAPLPFELACIPARFYKWARLPVVSYALPALIAIGQVRHHFVKPLNPLSRLLRWLARGRSLAILEKIQPASGGFLEATPLTSFVTMSLAGMGLVDHPVTRRGVDFLTRSVRPDGSWPIDTNLATWVTTLSINALGADLPSDAAAPLLDWLLRQQYREVHPYTNADPGGWAWTDLSGGVPDADDTPGAILAIIELERHARESHAARRADAPAAPAGSFSASTIPPVESQDAVFPALARGVGWLLDLQNGDGGWPTFCRGWGTLPFDRSAPDLTAHAIRALTAFLKWTVDSDAGFVAMESSARPLSPFAPRKAHSFRSAKGDDLGIVRPTIERAIDRGFQYLTRAQRADGSWLPLWFGNQHAPNDENPTYGTARVLAGYLAAGRATEPACQRGIAWLRRAQNADGGWGGSAGIVSSIEETALALEVLLALETSAVVPADTITTGLIWLLDQIDNGKLMEPSPIGFYFAKLWYFEKLYPLIFSAGALRRAAARYGCASGAETKTHTIDS